MILVAALEQIRQPQNLNVMRLIVVLLNRHKLRVATVFIVVMLSALFDVGVLSVFAFAVAVVVDGTETMLGILPGRIGDVLRDLLNEFSEDRGSMYLFGALLLGGVIIQLASSVISYIRSVITLKLSVDLARALYTRLVRQVVSADYEWIQGYSTGELIALPVHQKSLGTIAFAFVTKISTSLIMLGIYMSVSLMVSWELTLALVIFGVTLSWGVLKLSVRIKRRSHRYSDLVNELSIIAADFFSLPRVIRLTNTEETVFQEIDGTHQSLMNNFKSIGYLRALLNPITDLFSIVVVALMLLVTASYATDAAVAVAEAFAVIVLGLRAKPHLTTLSDSVLVLSKELPSSAIATKFLNETKPSQAKVWPGDESVFEEEIRLVDLSLTYRNGVRALDQVNLRIKRGQRIAILGGSGSGKSSLIDVISGLRQPTSGEMLVDGRILTTKYLSGWRKLLGVVDQETILVRGSIRKNVLFGSNYTTKSDLDKAIRISAMEELIADLPKGYDSPVGERGALLSGGQRQRIALARALVRRPVVLLLDEPTSSLDEKTEGNICESLRNLPPDITIIMVTHRLSALKAVDEAVILDEGRIVFHGNTHEAMGHYNREVSAPRGGETN